MCDVVQATSLVVRSEQGGEVEEAAEWWEACEQAERDEWCEQVRDQEAEEEARRLHAKRMAVEQQERAELAAKARQEEEERLRTTRRKEQALRNREEALKLAKQLGADRSEDVSLALATGGTVVRTMQMEIATECISGCISECISECIPRVSPSACMQVLTKTMGIELAREAAAAAARANPLSPKKIEAPGLGLAVGVHAAAALAVLAVPPDPMPEAPTTASLARCGYWFEDADEAKVKVTVPLEAVLDGRPGEILNEEGVVRASFTDLGFRLEVQIGSVTHVLTQTETLYRLEPKESVAKVRVKTKRVVLELAKFKRGQAWKSLST